MNKCNAVLLVTSKDIVRDLSSLEQPASWVIQIFHLVANPSVPDSFDVPPPNILQGKDVILICTRMDSATMDPPYPLDAVVHAARTYCKRVFFSGSQLSFKKAADFYLLPFVEEQNISNLLQQLSQQELPDPRRRAEQLRLQQQQQQQQQQQPLGRTGGGGVEGSESGPPSLSIFGSPNGVRKRINNDNGSNNHNIGDAGGNHQSLKIESIQNQQKAVNEFVRFWLCNPFILVALVCLALFFVYFSFYPPFEATSTRFAILHEKITSLSANTRTIEQKLNDLLTGQENLKSFTSLPQQLSTAQKAFGDGMQQMKQAVDDEFDRLVKLTESLTVENKRLRESIEELRKETKEIANQFEHLKKDIDEVNLMWKILPGP